MEHGKRWTFVKYKCRCKACCAANDAYMREYRAKNKAKILEVEKARYQRNKDAIIERMRDYYNREAEAILERYKWSDVARQRADWEAKRRARKSDAAVVEEILARAVLERDGGSCGICGKAIVGPAHLDHIMPLSRGGEHTYRNIQLAHPKCNERKHNRLPTEAELSPRR